MGCYYVFFMCCDQCEYYLGCVNVGELLPDELERYCNIVKETNPAGKNECYFDEKSHDLMRLSVYECDFLIQKERKKYSLEEKFKIKQIEANTRSSRYGRALAKFLYETAERIREERKSSDTTPQKKSRRKNKSTQTGDIEEDVRRIGMAANKHKRERNSSRETCDEEAPFEPLKVEIQNPQELANFLFEQFKNLERIKNWS